MVTDDKNDILYRASTSLIFLRNEFYRLSYAKLMLTLLVSLIFNGVMIVMVCWLFSTSTPPVYFATDPDGRLLDEKPLDDPLLTEDQVKSFAVKVAKTATSYDYLNYRRDLQNARQYFTDRGFDGYIEALDQSHNLQTVKDEQLVTRGDFVGEVRLRQSAKGGRVVWYVEVPMNVRYESQSLKILQPVIVHLLVGRVKTTQSLYAIQVAQIWIEDRGKAKYDAS